MAGKNLWEEDLRGGQTWSHIVRKSQAIRITDIEGGANAAMLLYNAANATERYNMPDTLKAQHTARLTKGFVLYSDMGRILCSITHDDIGWHDPIGGLLGETALEAKYGVRNYQDARNDWYQAPRESLILELAKYNLGARDMTPTVNLFSKVEVDAAGEMRYVPDNSKGGDSVELRAEMEVLVLLHANHHPLETGNTYAPKPVRVALREVRAPGEDDPCRVSRPENERGFILTARYTS